MSAELHPRLTRFLQRERAADLRAHHESREQPLAQRVEDGDCLWPLELLNADRAAGRFLLRISDNLAKFRPGDPVWLSDGADPESGLALSFAGYDPNRGTIELARDRFRAPEGTLPSGTLAIDRRHIEGYRNLHEALARAFASEDPIGRKIDALLGGRLATELHPEAHERARTWAAGRDLDESQREALAGALAAPDVFLIQGPPGTGKTRVLAQIVEALVQRGRSILVTAFTHTAINNALACIQRSSAVRGIYKLSAPEQAAELRGLPIRVHPAARALGLPARGFVAGATCYGALKLAAQRRFDAVVMDEAGQVALPHAVAALLAAPRWILIGDHQQMRPVLQGSHAEPELERSIFEHLQGSCPDALLATTYRMNAELCDFSSRHFYGGALRPAPARARARMAFRPGGRYSEILDPERPSVFVDLDHVGNPTRSLEEARLAAELVAELVLHHGLAPAEVALIAPFRAQNRALQSACERAFARRGARLPREIVADTVERMQGQEADVVILSLTTSDEGWLERKIDFFCDPGRLNVALTRARVKRIVLGSRALLRARPGELGEIRKMNLVRQLLRETPAAPAPELP